MRLPMPSRRAETAAAAGRGASPSEVQLMRALIAVAIGMLLALWVMRPVCTSPNVRTMLPELRALAGIHTLVI